MKRFRVMAAALCAVVLLCGFSVPAYAYADGGEGADYGDPTMTEETPAPEPTIEPGEGFSEEGNLVTRDMLQRGGVQLFHILNQIGKLDGIGVAIIKKLLGRDTEVFTDIEQTL